MSKPNRMRRVIEHLQRQEFSRAESLCRELLVQRPDEGGFYALLGTVLLSQKDYEAALECFDRAHSLGIDDYHLHLNRGIAAKHLDDWDTAEAALSAAAAMQPSSVECLYQMGEVQRLQGHFDAALNSFARVAEQRPDFVDAHAARALIHEQRHELEAAADSASMALRYVPGHITAKLLLARVKLRQGKAEEVAGLLDAFVKAQTLAPQNRAYAFNMLGQACEELQDFKRAFRFFSQAKAAQKTLYASREITGQSVYSLSSIARTKKFFEQQDLTSWHSFTPEEPVRLAFLVGFPRSGTTLMEQILAAHPGIETIEEQATLADSLAELLSPEGMTRLPELSDEEILAYREKYWIQARRYCNGGAANLIVDKLPLNTVALGLIWRLFPEAKVIFALRDPRAVTLSCFKQNFGPNDAMVNMLSLESIARYYAAVMGLGLHFRDTLPLQRHSLRYEDLVDDLEGETRRLLEFLNLDWNPALLHYREKAKQRRINTPSYQHVVKPIYRSSKARWRDYEKHLQPIMPLLTPFIQQHGYAHADS